MSSVWSCSSWHHFVHFLFISLGLRTQCKKKGSASLIFFKNTLRHVSTKLWGILILYLFFFVFWFFLNRVSLFHRSDVTAGPGHSSAKTQGWDSAKKERVKERLQMRKGIHVRLSWVYSPSCPQLSLKVFPLLASLWFWLQNPHILQ